MCDKLSSADLALACRLEAVEAATGRVYVNALRRWHPESRAAVLPVAGGWAVFAGPGSPLTHALGIGMHGPVEEAEFDRLEDFFRSRASAVVIDLCPLSDASVHQLIQQRGYRVIEFNNVLARQLSPSDVFPAPCEGLTVRRALPEEGETWARVVASGFTELEQPPSEFVDMFRPAPELECFLGYGGGEALAGAALCRGSGVAALFGAATVARGRGRGFQSALIAERLRQAARNGCDLAMASVLPGSLSHRNYERAGFQLIYMRVNLMRP